jgi:hypothetical protein
MRQNGSRFGSTPPNLSDIASFVISESAYRLVHNPKQGRGALTADWPGVGAGDGPMPWLATVQDTVAVPPDGTRMKCNVVGHRTHMRAMPSASLAASSFIVASREICRNAASEATRQRYEKRLTDGVK